MAAIKQVRFNVRDFGAKGDGTTDDSSAFIACRNAIFDSISTLPNVSGGGDGNRRPDYVFYIPAGKYKIISPEALMSFSHTTITLGLTFEGEGKYVTWINFQPTVADSYLLRNNNAFMHMTFRDMSFVATSATNACWMESTSTAFAQNYAFERVAWGGTWKYGLVLLGTNTNSEMSWHHCNCNGSWNTFLYVPDSVGMQGDQFVNYNFFACNFEIGEGSFIDMAYGGSIGIWGGSWMYYAGTSVGGTMFNLRNRTHNSGACRFLMVGTRVELPKEFCKMFYCEWSSGAVGFYNVDNSTQQWLPSGTTDVVNVTFDFGNESGPAVTWSNCAFQGKHEYIFGTSGKQRAARVNYDNCLWWHWTSPAQAVVLTGSPLGNSPMIRFNMCQGKPGTDQSKYAWDTTIGWEKARSGFSTKKIISLGTGNSSRAELPTNAQGDIDVWLPLGSIITKVYQSMEGGDTAVTDPTNWTYDVRTYEAVPTVIASHNPANPSLGGQKTSDAFFYCDSDEKRHIRLSAGTAVNSNVWGFTIIEYI